MRFDLFAECGLGFDLPYEVTREYDDGDGINLEYIADAVSDFVDRKLFDVIYYKTQDINKEEIDGETFTSFDNRAHVAVVVSKKVAMKNVYSVLRVISLALVKMEYIKPNETKQTLGDIMKCGLSYDTE